MSGWNSRSPKSPLIDHEGNTAAAVAVTRSNGVNTNPTTISQRARPKSRPNEQADPDDTDRHRDVVPGLRIEPTGDVGQSETAERDQEERHRERAQERARTRRGRRGGGDRCFGGCSDRSVGVRHHRFRLDRTRRSCCRDGLLHGLWDRVVVDDDGDDGVGVVGLRGFDGRFVGVARFGTAVPGRTAADITTEQDDADDEQDSGEDQLAGEEPQARREDDESHADEHDTDHRCGVRRVEAADPLRSEGTVLTLVGHEEPTGDVEQDSEAAERCEHDETGTEPPRVDVESVPETRGDTRENAVVARSNHFTFRAGRLRWCWCFHDLIVQQNRRADYRVPAGPYPETSGSSQGYPWL